MKRSALFAIALACAAPLPGSDPEPVARWSFDGSAPETGKAEGAVTFQQEGPPPKQFKQFGATNRAARFEAAKGGFIRVKDPGEKSLFDFDNGDAITIEAWVNPASAPKGGNIYILGKGRTANPGQASDNQNYGLRLWDSGGFLRLSFLFRSRKDGDHASDWHRWTTTGGFAANSGWHHVAVAYEFGSPETVRGYIDGEPAPGAWDMGGATKQAPVVDNDEVWIGTSMGRRPGVSFDGLMDEVRLYRGILPEKAVAGRYPVEPYIPIIPEAGLPMDKVRVEIVENIGKAAKWPRQYPAPVDVYEEEAFGFFQTAQKYTGTGVREARSNPFLLRAMANVTLPPGDHEFLVRARGQARLWMDGKVVAEIAPGRTGGDANKVEDHSEADGPALRLLGPGDREARVSVQGNGKPHVFVFEMIAGNGRVRTTLGETSLSLRHADGRYVLLSPSPRVVPLTDDGWDAYRKERLAFYEKLDQRRRLALRAKQDDYWTKRHAEARGVIAARPATKPGGIDALLAASWDKSNAASQRAASTLQIKSNRSSRRTASVVTKPRRKAVSASTRWKPP